MAESSWIEADAEFTKTLSKVVGGFLEKGILPNLVYRNRTLWGHFLKTIWGANSDQFRLKPLKEWKQHALRAAQSFLDHGADHNYILSGGLVAKLECCFDALVSYKLMGRKPLYITAGRGVTDPLTGAGFSVTGLDSEKYRRLEGLAVRGVLHEVFSQEQAAFLLRNI